VVIVGLDHVQLAAPAVRLQSGGAEVDWDTSLHPLKRFYTHDPWGNRIELTEGPPAALVDG